MSNKTMLLGFAVAAVLALPASASAQETHVTGITSFTGHAPTSTLSGSGEPKITATTTTISGSFDSGSSTTGKMTLDFTGATAEFLGIKGNCNTAGAASGTIAMSGAFHIITVNNRPGLLLTPANTTIICIGFSRLEIAGNVIGTITSPGCKGSSNNLVVSFESVGTTQNHIEYTAVKYDLVGHTENSAGETTGSVFTVGFNATMTVSSFTPGTLECT